MKCSKIHSRKKESKCDMQNDISNTRTSLFCLAMPIGGIRNMQASDMYPDLGQKPTRSTGHHHSPGTCYDATRTEACGDTTSRYTKAKK